jgi:threonine/homoserine/homoserine lactone efflux protein
VLLGIRSIRERKQLAGVLRSNSVAPRSLGRTIREGFIVGLTNPKGVLIFTAVLPQFIDRSQGHYTLQLLSLGLLCAVVALLSDSTWALASGTARNWLGRSPRRLERLSIGGGISLIALGAGLALTGRKS